MSMTPLVSGENFRYTLQIFAGNVPPLSILLNGVTGVWQQVKGTLALDKVRFVVNFLRIKGFVQDAHARKETTVLNYNTFPLM